MSSIIAGGVAPSPPPAPPPPPRPPAVYFNATMTNRSFMKSFACWPYTRCRKNKSAIYRRRSRTGRRASSRVHHDNIHTSDRPAAAATPGLMTAQHLLLAELETSTTNIAHWTHRADLFQFGFVVPA
ncbi:hypothetical protein EVAR_87248_1 [Eumeta japonica]|uniref:Uncharacterized protein n=1 Tax=Eumeta variegata TaxID=151549 RepID=A0A4C1YKD6_EUMVA|nr:hypothetical protein EVAR_87248_1 [Eumeta japonica]